MTDLRLVSDIAAVRKIHVIQGEHAISADPATMLTTVLGSCVSACMHDPEAGVGGMNHFLLAEDQDGARREAAMRYGAYAMEVLINDLMKLGARRQGLTAKLFGGAKMFEQLADIGGANAAFGRRFLAAEGIPLTGSSLGGHHARRVEFWPTTGRARQREVNQVPEASPVRPSRLVAASGGVELF